jgi:hypothetical protein
VGRLAKGTIQNGQGELSRVMNRLVDAAVEIQQAPDAAEKAYMARQLIQCTLPHSDPGDVPLWSRKNGGLTLTVQPLRDRKTGAALYPYGTYPRLLLFWIVTEASQTKSRRLHLGRSLSRFMDKLELPIHSGGKRGAPKRLREQMTRLLRATISFEQTYGDNQSWIDMQVGPVAALWWDPSKDEQDALFESWIELGEQFFQAVTANAVPVDMRALRGLKKSPLALDLYAWLSYKSFIASKSGKAQPVSWEGLHAQMGAEYAELRMFKFKVLRAIRKIRLVYPGLDVDTSSPDYLLVKPGRPAVASRTTLQR